MVAPPATPRMVMDQVTFAPACGNDAASFGTMLEIIDCWNVMASANSTRRDDDGGQAPAG